MHVLVGKWISLGFGGVGFVLSTGGLLYGRDTGMLEPGGPILEVIAIAAPIGVMLWLFHSLLMNLYQGEVTRLQVYVESVCRADAPSRKFESRAGLEPVAQAVERAVHQMRNRLDRLVSKRRELEVQVRVAEAERRHAESIINSINDAVIVTDAFNEVAIANASAAQLLGFPLDDAMRQPVDGVLDDPTLVKLIKDTREIGDTALRRHVEHRVSRGGADAVYDVSLSCVSTDTQVDGYPHSSEAAGVVAIMRDVTREKEIAEMKSDFVSNVSHELRTPLSSIKAYMEMLIDGEAQDDETRADFYNIIQGEANRLDRLIDNILNINRIESGVVKVQRTQISLPAVIKEVIDVMLPQAHAKEIKLVEMPSPVFFQVYADKDMIYQAVLNLISNAIKYTPNGGEVTVGVDLDEQRHSVTIIVRDTGVGIPEEALPHLFDKFFRVQNHKKIAKGTGLGLNLVKHIVETVHGGRVWVESEVDKGSTFRCSLPLMNNGQ